MSLIDQLNVWDVNDLGESMVKNTLEQWLNIFNNKSTKIGKLLKLYYFILFSYNIIMF